MVENVGKIRKPIDLIGCWRSNRPIQRAGLIKTTDNRLMRDEAWKILEKVGRTSDLITFWLSKHVASINCLIGMRVRCVRLLCNLPGQFAHWKPNWPLLCQFLPTPRPLPPPQNRQRSIKGNKVNKGRINEKLGAAFVHADLNAIKQSPPTHLCTHGEGGSL